MKRICALLCLLLAIGCTPALAASDITYQLPDSTGIIHGLYVHPGGDLILYGWFDALDTFDYHTDGMVVRVTPQGEVVWVCPFPYVSELGSGGLIALGNGDYLKPEFAEDWHASLYYMDGEEGLAWVSEPVRGHTAVPGDDGFYLVDAVLPSTLRVRQLDYEGNETRVRDYALGSDHDTAPWVIASGGGLLYYSTSDMVTKILADGTVAWRKPFTSPTGYVSDFISDYEGGFYMVSRPVPDAYEDFVARVSSEGEYVWERTLAVSERELAAAASDENGLHLIFVDGDVVRHIAIDKDGNEASSPLRSLSSALDMALNPRISGLFFAEDGTAFVYGTIDSPISPTRASMRPFVRAVSDFALLP